MPWEKDKMKLREKNRRGKIKRDIGLCCKTFIDA